MIAYRIVAVPERLERATVLAGQLDAQIILDENHAGTFANHVCALRSVGHATHAVILEDDAILCADFTDHVGRLITERPDHLLGLYVGRSHPKRVQPLIERVINDPQKSVWLDDLNLTDRLRWAVGYVMPVKDIPDVLDGLVGGHAWLNTDGRIGGWHAAQGRLSYPFPSPVEHDDSLPSTTSRGKSARVAWKHCEGVTL